MLLFMNFVKQWINNYEIYIYSEDCPYKSIRTLKDKNGEFHLCYREDGDCECIPNGCPYLIAVNSNLNLPDISGYYQI